jgi:hypothetical protein
VAWLESIKERDELAYPAHTAVGTALNLLGVAPSAAATQWIKAASHARSTDDIARAARGIAAARQRSEGDGAVDSAVCAIALHGSPAVQAAASLGGAACGPNLLLRYHVPDGAPIAYPTRPPIGGPHYNAWYPSYGVVEQPIPPGYWVHNLEHGAVVLLYRCPQGCPELVGQVKELYAGLPLGSNARGGAPRLLAMPYSDMDHTIAVIAWGHLLELDRLDREQIVAFYETYLDRGPECRNLSCPE